MLTWIYAFSGAQSAEAMSQLLDEVWAVD